MDFSFSDDQIMFRDTVRDFLTSKCPPEVVRSAWHNDTGRTGGGGGAGRSDGAGRADGGGGAGRTGGADVTNGLWGALAQMGVVGMTAPESDGGLGMDEIDLVLLLEEAGRAALPEPLLEHTAVGIPTLVEDGGPVARDWLERAASGEATLGAGSDSGYVVGAASSDLVLLIGDRVGAVPVAGASLVAHPSIDGSRRLYEVGGDAVVLDADPGLAFDRAASGAAAICVGVAQHLLDTTVEYVSQRHQFGKPVGTYQAVKHHLANVALKLEFARPAVHHAAWCIATGSSHRSRDVSLAKALASEAVDLAARTALQCHGAIGYTFEYDLHLWMKRGWALAAAWGDTAWHRNRIADALGI
ncbi:acyl-CoA dehydrogenase family protein [Candidatus Poriferisocius sp.]|uniref:acyl-CoA dehydrogenase family protein n=1 Tax=Candidatus Poriferisocius sp. TaxID=3101276 RepID=UPI003B02C2E0